MKHTHSEVAEFSLEVQSLLKTLDRRQARRFLDTPETITGFDIPLDFALSPGRAPLVQVRDFEESK